MKKQTNKPKAKESKKKESSSTPTPKDEGSKWQEYLRRHK
ncbi:MAG: hypothetical protein K1000chlam2_01724, partial [Chlamydiae bacterium]|nr:hypothetical protein [Chlamydiota bacterium]